VETLYQIQGYPSTQISMSRMLSIIDRYCCCCWIVSSLF